MCVIFVTLQIEMKGIVTKFFAAMLVVWYLVGIIGFDVHTCSGSGRSFAVAFFEGVTCEDIHPEHCCDPSACCADKHETHSCCCCHCDGMTVSAKSCCSDDYFALEIAGTVSQDDHRHYDECSCGHCPCLALHASEAASVYETNLITAYILHPDPGVVQACDRQAVFSVWRI